MFRHMPFILAGIIAVIVLLDPFIPLQIKQLLYSLSLSIKNFIVFILPFIIFSLLLRTIAILSKSATKILGAILLLVCCSNFLSTFISRFIGSWVHSMDVSMINPTSGHELQSQWALTFPKLIGNEKALFAGVIVGIIVTRFFPEKTTKMGDILGRIVHAFLKGIVYVIPLFVAGFIIKLQHDGVVQLIVKDYSLVFMVIAIGQFAYIAFVYFVLNTGSLSGALRNIKNMIPAAISGFSTMSSAASMPLTIYGAELNAENKDVAKLVIPTTVNIHLIGDCFAIPIFAYAIIKSFGMPEPTMMSYLIFSFYFVIAKFSVAAIPGGGVLVMLPILEGYLGFNSEMISLMTALYILFDPVITSANVLGNGAFAKLIDIIKPGLARQPSRA